MLKGTQIMKIGLFIYVIAMAFTHIAVGVPHEATSFFMGMGFGICIAGAGKRFVENGNRV